MVQKAKKTKSAPAPAPVPVPEPVVEQPKEEVVDQESSIELVFKGLYDKITLLKTELSKLQSDVRDVHKQVKKHNLQSAKQKKKKLDRPKREPSGFAKPTPISQELCDFLSKPLGTKLARTEVTKYLTSYIKENDLQFPDDKRKIKPDAKPIFSTT